MSKIIAFKNRYDGIHGEERRLQTAKPVHERDGSTDDTPHEHLHSRRGRSSNIRRRGIIGHFAHPGARQVRRAVEPVRSLEGLDGRRCRQC